MQLIKDKFKILEKIKIDPNNYNLNLNLGMIYVGEKKFTDAKMCFKKLIQIDKSRYEGYLNLSNIYGIENKYNQSENTLKNYVKKNGYHKDNKISYKEHSLSKKFKQKKALLLVEIL